MFIVIVLLVVVVVVAVAVLPVVVGGGVVVVVVAVVVVVVVVVVAITYQTPLHREVCSMILLGTTGPDTVDMPSGVPSRTEVIPTATFL